MDDDDDDPFSCFGSSDDENSAASAERDDDGGSEPQQDETSTSSSRTAELLADARRRVEEANAVRAAAGVGASASRQLDDGPADFSVSFVASPLDVSLDEPSSLPNDLQILNPFPHRKPLYLSPSVAVCRATSLGGGRGLVALRPLPPGHLVLLEEPSVQWPDDQLGRELGLASVREVVARDGIEGKEGIVRDLELLHPTKEAVDKMLALEDGSGDAGGGGSKSGSSTNEKRKGDGEKGNSDNDGFRELLQVQSMMSDMRDRYITSADDLAHIELANIVELASRSEIQNSDGSPFGNDDALRVLLALRYNGFESGLCFWAAMINHDDYPNCIKYSPPSSDDDDAGNDGEARAGGAKRNYSEVRTTRPVRAGESLTLHYLNPREVSHATRRRRLWEQHRFDVGKEPYASSAEEGDEESDSRAKRAEELRSTELVQGVIPPSSIETLDESSPTFRIESALESLEETLVEIKAGLLKGVPEGIRYASAERAEEMEVAAMELCTTAEEELGNPKHVLLIRCRRLHAEACEAVLRGSDFRDGDANSDERMSRKQLDGVAARFLISSRKSLKLKILLFGKDHPDVASSLLDCAEGIAGLLVQSPGELAKLNLSDGEEGEAGKDEKDLAVRTKKVESRATVLARWSKEEARLRKEWRRVSGLYPKDAEDYIGR